MINIPYGRQEISQADIEAVQSVLISDWLTQGPVIANFEQSVAKYCGAKYAVAVSNATAALHLACLAFKLGPGDYLWTSPNTFVASANCALYCGAEVDFVDIDVQTFNISVAALSAKLEQAERTGTLPKVLVPVHFAGQSCEMSELRKLSQQYGFYLLEDASHAIGGSYQGSKVGACEYSDVTVFSFHPVKIITSGEGGMVLTNDEQLYQALLRLRSHGITRDPRFLQGESDGPWCYQQLDLGYNYRMTDMQAALGLSQMQRLDEFVAIRRRRVDAYRLALADLPLRLPESLMGVEPAWHLQVVSLDDPAWRKPVFDALRAIGIQVNVHYQPVYLQPYYRQLGFSPGLCPEAERYYHGALTLPLYPGMSDQDFDFIVSSFRNILSEIAL
ncbi:MULTISPECIES: UDP-4-amino-4,6-dideoxy-N-acetyl-beta-L-altrosamine transaminase [Chromobacterium]|uniref:UDP-4-amino-4, 6-dideoxy-N-acetyl-beta-L-altrosamine transaminase n=1 Tax=Chromobacterium TaxID=535 RepID=UPI0005B76FB9|nr:MULTISPECIES: UDP-4-amino-4,6-dideoxy-N-acetyl-beta-L-altrosamine transaminase [Chromobacterium]QOZ82914.1 UDP-4-amino-4,6-dideoxy-N-acetyl-beta-L-altrosamine transaminase [Chromobacterium sp. Rain0013]WON82991.1 UDP-4-amino-4,6-dideoxy-N-acetyl-beta-L-altrosamine transaminase [Chromobacterium haemolyticum]